jgi:hypothetical protein
MAVLVNEPFDDDDEYDDDDENKNSNHSGLFGNASPSEASPCYIAFVPSQSVCAPG